MNKWIITSIARSFIFSVLFAFIFYSCELDNNNIDEDNYEPNDSEEKATQINTFDSINGYIGVDDVDYYEFNAERNYIDFTQVNITNLDSYNEIETRIYDEYLDEIAKIIGTQGEDIKMQCANSGGTYFIKLKSYNDKQGEYTLSVRELNANDDYEPDNTIEQGREINSYPTDELVGTILTDDDYSQVDYECFQLMVRSGKRVNFDIIPSSSKIALKLQIYNASKELIETVEKQEGESITTWYLYNTDASDVYMYLKLSGNVPDNGGNYRISFEEVNYQGIRKGSGVQSNH
jgi:hypothetical protein